LHYAEPQGRKDCEAGLTENGETENGKLTQRSECRGQTCLHYAEPQGRKDCEAGLTENGERKTDRCD